MNPAKREPLNGWFTVCVNVNTDDCAAIVHAKRQLKAGFDIRYTFVWEYHAILDGSITSTRQSLIIQNTRICRLFFTFFV